MTQMVETSSPRNTKKRHTAKHRTVVSKHRKNSIMKKWLVFALVVSVALSVFVWEYFSHTPLTNSGIVKLEPSVTMTSLDGAWVSENPNPDMIAEINNATITISWNNSETKQLYWLGNFPVPYTSFYRTDKFEIVSSGDTETMAGALMASRESSKRFLYDGKLSFELGIVGTTQTIKLVRRK